jgi:hypothetical protein
MIYGTTYDIPALNAGSAAESGHKLGVQATEDRWRGFALLSYSGFSTKQMDNLTLYTALMP